MMEVARKSALRDCEMSCLWAKVVVTGSDDVPVRPPNPTNTFWGDSARLQIQLLANFPSLPSILGQLNHSLP